MATDLCHPIVKYSHATGARENHSIPWSHLQAATLCAVVKGTDTHFSDGRLRPDGKLVVSIVDGTNVLVRNSYTLSVVYMPADSLAGDH